MDGEVRSEPFLREKQAPADRSGLERGGGLLDSLECRSGGLWEGLEGREALQCIEVSLSGSAAKTVTRALKLRKMMLHPEDTTSKWSEEPEGRLETIHVYSSNAQNHRRPGYVQNCLTEGGDFSD